MITLGINAAFHDSAAALVSDGVVVAAAEEERFTRIRHAKRPVPFSAWELPFQAIDFCLAQAGITLRDVDHVAYSFDPELFIGGRLAGPLTEPPRITLPLQPSAQATGGWEQPWDPLFAAHIVNAPSQLAGGAPHDLHERLGGIAPDEPPWRWHFIHHALCHQASAFLAAPFDSCAVMTLDGRGELASTTYGAFRGQRYEPMGEVRLPHSLGLLYERVTGHLGFLPSSDEYKVMALAALGTPRFRGLMAEHIRTHDNGQYEIAPMDLTLLFGPARAAGAALEEHHLDLAASLQDVLEETVLRLARRLHQASGEQRLAMAGSLALNCVMNARLRDAGIFEEIWVQPAAGDAGTALGAALWSDARERGAPDGALGPRRWAMDHACLGPGYGDEAIEAQLRRAQLRYRRTGDLAAETASLLAAGRIVGWFQGRMEFGPCALGARSILASPIDPHMQVRLNALKGREDFRPVACAIPQPELGHWFAPADANQGRSPFMLFTYDVLPGQAGRIPAACHTDHSARVLTVEHDTNPRLHALLHAFSQRTGVPVLVNTSFNLHGEPIVCTPRDAIEAFYGTPLDALVIGPFVLEKG